MEKLNYKTEEFLKVTHLSYDDLCYHFCNKMNGEPANFDSFCHALWVILLEYSDSHCKEMERWTKGALSYVISDIGRHVLVVERR